MRRFLFCLALLLSSGAAPAAAPGVVPPALTGLSLRDLDARLPERVVGMQRQPGARLNREDKRLTAQYGVAGSPLADEAADENLPLGLAARGAVFVLPVSQQAEGSANLGATVRAQIAMLDATVDNLRRGTHLLGEGYTTSLARTAILQAGRLSLACAAVTRRQAPGKGEQQLLDRRCFFEMPGYVIGVTASTPFRGTDQAARESQLAFIMAITRALTDPAR
ncbi:hypothetical protein FOZ76_10015 [Verticiella sediminum]|uniref:Uncharacterized protein n=1 Tax=Verticiella sediminum TaxID=1247510 RepID=A0A556AS16_9BURK|nr:hypothetical protein [Verticiella sediminum]TSH95723.1 hypothetical protein FOZ76_10015 [Verticiella sediminum]